LTSTIYSSDLRLFMRKPKESFSWTTFSDVFNTELWVVLIIVYLVITISLYFEFKFSKVSQVLFAHMLIEPICWQTQNWYFEWQRQNLTITQTDLPFLLINFRMNEWVFLIHQELFSLHSLDSVQMLIQKAFQAAFFSFQFTSLALYYFGVTVQS
jgi:hypothetical protein